MIQDAIGSDEIQANAIGSDEVATGAIGADELQANAVGVEEIANDAITSNQHNSITSHITCCVSVLPVPPSKHQEQDGSLKHCPRFLL